MSQILDLGLSLNFMKSTKNIDEKITKIFPFFVMRTKTFIKMLRHISLQMNVFNVP